MTEHNKLKDLIKKSIRERFENVTIDNIYIQEDLDEDGDDILVVKIVFSGTRKQLDARKSSGFLRDIRPKIMEIGENAFPVISFISNSDFGKKAPATA